jgi:PAS domain S-box-containing protein
MAELREPLVAAGLGAFVRGRAPLIVAIWGARIRTLAAARDLDEPTLVDDIPDILERIAAELDGVEPPNPTALEDLAAQHANVRLAGGYDVRGAAWELAALRDVILELWEGGGGGPIAVRELRLLNRSIDETIVTSVERFTRARERTLVALERISSSALGTGDVEAFLPRLLTALLDTTGAADSAWLLVRGEDDVFRVHAAAGSAATGTGHLAAREGEGFVGTVASRREPLLVTDAAHDPLVDPALRAQGVRALYGVPLVQEERVIGIALMASRSAWELSAEDQQLFRAMAQRSASLLVQASLIATQRRMAEALEHGDAFLVLDRNYRIVLVNSSQERLSEKPRSETLGRVFWEVWPDIATPESRYWREYHRCMDERVAVAFEEYYPPLDLWTGVTAYPVRDGGIAVFFRDVTARKRAEERLRRLADELRVREAELRRIFAVTPDILAVVSPDGWFSRVNPAFSELLGWTEEELRSRPILEFVHEADRAATQTELRRLASGATAQRFLNRYRHRGGGYRWLSWNASADPETGFITAIARDVTDEKRRAEFEQQLIGIVSHDLRNPLHAILLGAHALLSRDDLDERTVRAVVRIRSSADRSTRMIQDLLDFTRARVGQGIPVSLREADLHRIARAAVDEVRATFPERDISFEATGDANGEWDPDRLAQVVTNLVVNAVKYGAADTRVTVRTCGGREAAALEVHNEGNPIPRELQGELFAPYRRGAPGHEPTSLGLGLFISHEIVRAHGGEIAVDSDPSRGTTFTVRLPRRGAGAAGVAGPTEIAGGAARQAGERPE